MALIDKIDYHTIGGCLLLADLLLFMALSATWPSSTKQDDGRRGSFSARTRD